MRFINFYIFDKKGCLLLKKSKKNEAKKGIY